MRVLGYRIQSGVSQKGEGSPYEMGSVCLAVPVEKMSTKNTKVDGKGLQGVEMPLQPEAFEAFAKMNFPCDVELVLDQRAFFGELKTVCVGVRPAVAAVKSA